MTQVLRFSAALLSVLVLIVASEAGAQTRAQRRRADARARVLFETGVEAYQEGRYEDAVTALESAYELSPRPLLLFNLANAHERLGHHAEAITALQAYLPDAEADERAQIETRIQNLQRRIEEEEAEEAAAAAEPAEEVARVDVGDPPPDFSALMLPGIILAAGGGALLVEGITFGALALDSRAQVTGGDDPLCSATADGRLLCSGAASSRIAEDEVFAILADIGLIGGGVVAAAGVTLIVLASIEPATDESVSWAPDLRVGPNGVSVGAVGSF